MRGAPWVIFFTTFIAYGYFFQGNGWNQAAHFATMRSLAERGAAEISPFTDHTQDVSYFSGGVYSNKPPGIALLGTPFYFVLMKVERAMHMEIDTERAWLRNLYVMTLLLAALPGAILNVQLFYALRREKLSIRAAMTMCGAFAFGSLSWPYGGMLMSHLATASLVFGAWQLLTGEIVSTRRAIGAGLLIAVGILCDFLTIPVAAVLGVYLLARRGGLKQFMVYGFAALLGIAANLLYDRLAHGSAMQSGPLKPNATFTQAGLFFGEFLAPDWHRIYWITYHPMRGLFVTCPIFLACLLSLLAIRRPLHFRLDFLAIALILGIYLIFYLTFYGWTGGWFVGPRYMIPALPLVWMFAIPAFKKFPRICALLTVLSIVQMLAVTSVCAMPPSPNAALVADDDPVRACLISLVQGRTNSTDDGFNLGEVLHLSERCQLIPIYALLVVFYGFAWKQRPGIKHAATCSDHSALQLCTPPPASDS